MTEKDKKELEDIIITAVSVMFDIGFVAVGVAAWNATRNPIIRVLTCAMVSDAIYANRKREKSKNRIVRYKDYYSENKESCDDFQMGFH